MKDYYKKNLAADRLRLVYQVAPPRVKQYLEAEIAFVLERIHPSDIVLELGCGYGRVLERLADKARLAVGIDTSEASLRVASKNFESIRNIRLLQMNAAMLAFADKSFDLVVCVQNGISAFHLDPRGWISESVRVTKPGGLVLISSYSAKFWKDRLEWFRIQSEHGLVGEIDWDATREGEIVCKDGFHGTTYTADRFAAIVSELGLRCTITEVDGSSL
ncbi:MAG: class I SAM-dependent methyltransferase, partial [Candidatus Zixiibacteriota bacterium]